MQGIVTNCSGRVRPSGLDGRMAESFYLDYAYHRRRGALSPIATVFG
jgi:hypothetical protein